MWKALRMLFMIWAGFWWFLGFFILYPFFCLCIWFKSIEPAMSFFNQIWCLIFFPISGLRVRTEGKVHLKRSTPVVYVSNHASYLDIPLLTYILPGFPAFMGKSSLGKIPVFGYMFRNLHVVVDRGSSQGRVLALKKSKKKLARGRSLVIFPEGSIHHKIQPGLADFKDGAFRLAVTMQVPIVPITICYNWFILPDDGRWLPHFYYCKSVIHPPISTKGMKEEDIPLLRQQTFDLIQNRLRIENRSFLSDENNT
jgi:1-acyl-sn-glycerol-3-phosphate acyltransferase